jgi:hypothetical protein
MHLKRRVRYREANKESLVLTGKQVPWLGGVTVSRVVRSTSDAMRACGMSCSHRCGGSNTMDRGVVCVGRGLGGCRCLSPSRHVKRGGMELVGYGGNVGWLESERERVYEATKEIRHTKRKE